VVAATIHIYLHLLILTANCWFVEPDIVGFRKGKMGVLRGQILPHFSTSDLNVVCFYTPTNFLVAIWLIGRGLYMIYVQIIQLKDKNRWSFYKNIIQKNKVDWKNVSCLIASFVRGQIYLLWSMSLIFPFGLNDVVLHSTINWLLYNSYPMAYIWFMSKSSNWNLWNRIISLLKCPAVYDIFTI